MVNELSFTQSAAILNSIAEQATGKASIAPLDAASFVTMAQATLKTGYDNVMGAISQVLSGTIFSNRPYTAQLTGLKADARRFGNHVRKISYIDSPMVDDEGANPAGGVDGQSVDHYKIRKPKVLQMNFYGQNVVQDFVTIYTKQLDVAFSGPEEFGAFISGLLQSITNKHEMKHDNIARLTLSNMIGAKLKADTGNVINLLTEYNAETGLTLTKADVFKPANYKPFMQWAYGYMANVSNLMRSRSYKYHMNIIGKEVPRHTPYENQKMYILSAGKYQLEARVLADTFHDNFISRADNEAIAFWQSIDSPDSINIKPSYLDDDGSVIKETNAIEQSDIYAVLFDEDACGYTTIDASLYTTPMNAAGRYYNMWWNFTDRWWNDLTENFVVFILADDESAGE